MHSASDTIYINVLLISTDLLNPVLPIVNAACRMSRSLSLSLAFSVLLYLCVSLFLSLSLSLSLSLNT